MQLTKEELVELNHLLKTSKLKLPEFRLSVSASGNNYAWLQKKLLASNPDAPSRLRELLKI